jgi:peptidoglycan/xylan/chitin deacetylase (PgdA/CDA1 family)
VEYALDKGMDAIVAERGIPERLGHTFSDTSDANILAAYRLGITGGTTAPTASSPGVFSPDGEFTREQAATMIMNACRVVGAKISDPPESGFADLGSASRWARDGINFAGANGIMSGTGNNNFSPKSIYTREQSIVTFNNIKPAELPKYLIALTFDDGPDLTFTPMVLDKLEKYGVAATFFVVGRLIDEETAPLLRRAFDMGNDIENHSWSHPHMSRITAEEVIEEIDKTSDKIEEVVGVRPSFFRPPFFDTAMHMRNLVDLPFIMAGIDPRDWAANATAERIARDILDQAECGGVILLHDSGGERTPTVESMDLFIPQLLARGYRFVTVRQLYELKGVEPRIWNGQWETKVPNDH